MPIAKVYPCGHPSAMAVGGPDLDEHPIEGSQAPTGREQTSLRMLAMPSEVAELLAARMCRLDPALLARRCRVGLGSGAVAKTCAAFTSNAV